MNVISVLRNKLNFKSYEAGNKSDIQRSEELLSLVFTQEYKDYLENFGFATYELTGICKSKRLNVVDVTIMERERFPDIPLDWYVVECLNIDGIVIWQSSSGEMYQTAPNSKPKLISESFADYISM